MNRAAKSKKFSAVLILVCFLSGEFLRPAGLMAMPLPVTEVFAPAAFQLELPPELGTVEMLVAGQGPTIIHIQEAHGDYDSQQKIESILHFLKDRYGVDLLLLEGNAFQLHTELLNFFPGREDLNRSILEDLAKKNLASGPEFFLQKSPGTEAWGIEDAVQYRENGQAFIQVLTQRTKTERFVNAMDVQIERLTSPYLNKDLRQYLKRLESFESSITPFEAWILELKDFAVKHLQKDVTSPALQLEWPMLVRLFVLKEFERRLDINAFHKERPAFLEVIKTLPEELLTPIKAHLESALSQNRLPDPGTSILFENMVSALPADFDYSRFSNVTLFIGHLILQSELKGERLFDELTRLSDLVADKLAEAPREKKITGLLKQHRLLKRLFRLELTAKDYAAVKKADSAEAADAGLRPSVLVKQFEKLNSDKLVRDYSFEHMDSIDALYERSLDFYRGAQERDGTMLEKIEERLQTSGKDRAAVITGGFHSGPFKSFFESKGYNYALITPRMTKIAPKTHEAYVGSVLANYIAPLQPAAATWRPSDFGVNAPVEIEAQGGNAPVVERQFRSAIVEIARRAGLSNEEVHRSIQQRRESIQAVTTALAMSEVRNINPLNMADVSRVELRKFYSTLQQRFSGSRVAFADARAQLRRIEPWLSATSQTPPETRIRMIDEAISALQVLRSWHAYTAPRAPSKEKPDAKILTIQEELLKIEGVADLTEQFESVLIFSDAGKIERELTTVLDSYSAVLATQLELPAEKRLNALWTEAQAAKTEQGFPLETVKTLLSQYKAAILKESLFPDRVSLQNLKTDKAVRLIISLIPDMAALFYYLDQLDDTTKEYGSNWPFLRNLSRQLVLEFFTPLIDGDFNEAGEQAQLYGMTLSQNMADSWQRVSDVVPAMEPLPSAFLRVSRVLRSEVRGTRRQFLQQMTAVAAALAAPVLAVGDEGPRGSKVNRDAAARRSEEAARRLKERIYDIANDTRETAAERKKDSGFLSEKAITKISAGDFNNGATPFEKDDIDQLIKDGMTEPAFETHVKWRRLVMDMAADIAKTFRPEMEAGKPVVKTLTQEEIGQIAWHLQRVKPEDVLSASVTGTPVFTERDLDKLILFKDPESFLHAYARAQVKIKMAVGDMQFYKGLLTPASLESKLTDYVPAGEAQAVADLKAKINKGEASQTDLDQKMADIRKQLVHDLATVIFELDRGNRAVPEFTIEDAGELYRQELSDTSLTIKDVLDYLAYRKSAQRTVEVTAERLIGGMYYGLTKGSLFRKALLAKQVKVKGLAAKEKAVVEDLMDFYLEKPSRGTAENAEKRSKINGDISALTRKIEALAKKLKELERLSGAAAYQGYADFNANYAAEVAKAQANIARALTEFNPKILALDLAAQPPVVLPIEVRFASAVELTAQDPYQLEMMMARDERLKLLEKDVTAEKGVKLRLLLGRHPGFVDFAYVRAFLRNKESAPRPTGFLGNANVPAALKTRLIDLIKGNQALFAALEKQLELVNRSEVRTSRRVFLLQVAAAAAAVLPLSSKGDELLRVSRTQAEAAQRRKPQAVQDRADKIYDAADDARNTEKLRKEKKDPEYLSKKSITQKYGGDFNEGAERFTPEDAYELAEDGVSPDSFEIHVKWRRLVMDMAADIVTTFKPEIGADGKSAIHKLTQIEVEQIAWHLQTVTPEQILSASLDKPVLNKEDYEKMKDDADKIILYRDPNFYLYHYARAQVKIKMSVGDMKYYAGMMEPSVMEGNFRDYVPAGAAEKIADSIRKISESPDDESLKIKLAQQRQEISERLFFDLATVVFELDKGNKAVPSFDLNDAKALLAAQISSSATVRDVLDYLSYRKAAQRTVESIAEEFVRGMVEPFPGVALQRKRLLQTKASLRGLAQKEAAVLKDLMEFYLKKPDSLALSADQGRSGINGDITNLTSTIQGFGKRYKNIKSFSEYAQFLTDYNLEVREQTANIARALSAYNARLLKVDLKSAADVRAADQPLILPIEVRFQAALRLTSQAKYGDKTERLVGHNPGLIDLIESEIKAGKSAPNTVTLFEFHRDFVQYQDQARRPDGLLNLQVGFLGNRDVPQALRDRVKELFDNQRAFIFGKLPKQLEGRAGDREKQTRVAVRSEVREASIPARELLTEDVFALGDNSAAVVERVSRLMPAVIVTAQPKLKSPLQSEMDRMDAVQAFVALFKTTNRPMQVIDEHQQLPQAEELLDRVLLAQQLQGLDFKVAVPILASKPEVKGLYARLDSLARRRLGVSLDALANFKLSAYSEGQSPAENMGEFLSRDIATAFLSAKRELAQKSSLSAGETVYRLDLNVLVDNESIRGNAVWAAAAAVLDQKTLDQLGHFQNATNLVSNQLSAKLRAQLKAIRAFMSAA